MRSSARFLAVALVNSLFAVSGCSLLIESDDVRFAMAQTERPSGRSDAALPSRDATVSESRSDAGSQRQDDAAIPEPDAPVTDAGRSRDASVETDTTVPPQSLIRTLPPAVLVPVIYPTIAGPLSP